jgi:hypothetical protein
MKSQQCQPVTHAGGVWLKEGRIIDAGRHDCMGCIASGADIGHASLMSGVEISRSGRIEGQEHICGVISVWSHCEVARSHKIHRWSQDWGSLWID